MPSLTRLPAFPLITNDPYFSIWSNTDLPTQGDTRHWAGERKRLTGRLTVDGTAYRFIGLGDEPAMEVTDITVTPTSTRYTYQAAGISLILSFTAPLDLTDLDLMSTPITFIDFSLKATDGNAHKSNLKFSMHDDICYDGLNRPAISGAQYPLDALKIAYMGQKKQSILCHTGDHITIDWGYAYFAAETGVSYEAISDHAGLIAKADFDLSDACQSFHLLAGYDDIASINYFGFLAPAWYARNGKTITDALLDFAARRAEILARCASIDEEIIDAAKKVAGDDYAFILSAAYRQTIAAHKLIADRDGKAVFLSKEDDSNGCIGTADVSYPSIPLYLMKNAELVRGMCRPILKFAHMPCWEFDFAPHDVGRYPYATGQRYAIKPQHEVRHGEVYPPLYLYPAGCDLYDFRYQMPVEECGNMLVMMAAAWKADGDTSLFAENMDLMDKWVKYLEEYGEDPGEQLCTDDFAGHMARNINLSAKAISGIASFALIKKALGDEAAHDIYMQKARKMAESWLKRAQAGDHTALTFDGNGWSQKYNLVWDLLFDLHLLPDSFYAQENAYYLTKMNTYGLPLDSRADYTKSDWIAWCAAMAPNREGRIALLAPMAKYLKETESRVAFSDWYNTVTGKYQSFINRTVQGGLFMPLLREMWKA